jgi:dTDP-4-dehydrorhamnose 3,5-epimerase
MVALEDDTVMSYLCSTGYAPDREKGVSPADPVLALPLPSDPAPLLSPRDTAAPTLAEAAERGLLPTYEQCRAFYASLR